jgi:hypothetical protein
MCPSSSQSSRPASQLQSCNAKRRRNGQRATTVWGNYVYANTATGYQFRSTGTRSYPSPCTFQFSFVTRHPRAAHVQVQHMYSARRPAPAAPGLAAASHKALAPLLSTLCSLPEHLLECITSVVQCMQLHVHLDMQAAPSAPGKARGGWGATLPPARVPEQRRHSRPPEEGPCRGAQRKGRRPSKPETPPLLRSNIYGAGRQRAAAGAAAGWPQEDSSGPPPGRTKAHGSTAHRRGRRPWRSAHGQAAAAAAQQAPAQGKMMHPVGWGPQRPSAVWARTGAQRARPGAAQDMKTHRPPLAETRPPPPPPHTHTPV